MTFFETYIITLSHYFKILMFSLQGQMHIFFIRADAYLKSISYRYFKKNSRWCNFPLENNLIHWNKDLLMNQHSIILSHYHCVKSIQIRIFFWSVFSCIWAECGELRSKSPYLVRIQENRDQKKLRIWTLFTQCM